MDDLEKCLRELGWIPSGGRGCVFEKWDEEKGVREGIPVSR